VSIPGWIAISVPAALALRLAAIVSTIVLARKTRACRLVALGGSVLASSMTMAVAVNAVRSGQSVDGVLHEIETRVTGTGVLGGQRQFEAAIGAIRGINVANPAPFFGDAVDAVVDGISVQRAVSYGQAVTPGAASGPDAARAVAGSSAKATGEAARVGTELTSQFQTAIGQATQVLRDQVKADQQVFQAQLLRDDGPIAVAQKEAKDVRGALETVNRALIAKADLQFVTDFVRQRG